MEGNIKKGSMKKIFGLLTTLLLLNGCAESVALLGTSVVGASSGKMLQSSLNTSISYGVKKQTGKGPLEHVVAYAEKVNPEKKKEPCVSFLEKTNSELCLIVKKQLILTKSKIKNLVVTDTIDNSDKVKKSRNIEVLSISNLLAEAMKRISNSTSVSDLFK